jgi:hypothetical protein
MFLFSEPGEPFSKEPKMKERIGETAGKIWMILKEREEVAISQLPKLTGETPTVAYQALGWLAREDKVVYRAERNKTYVAIAASERVD